MIRLIKNKIKKIRQIYYSKFISRKAMSIGKNLKINGKSRISKRTVLGDNVNFNGMIINGNGNVTIGNNFHSGINCQIITQNHNYNKGKAIPYDDTYIYKDIKIEDNVWLGNNVIILGSCKIGEGAILQAGSVVIGNIPKYAIAGGNPAKVFKYRDIEHYENLKKEKQFH